MPGVWVSIGSNIDRVTHIREAVQELRETFGPLRLSGVYESDAIGFEGAPFYNLVVGFDTGLSIPELNARFRAMEDAHDRVRTGNKFAPRTLDMDLLTYGQAIHVVDGQSLPREEILRYAFVLGPLAEVAGKEVHPSTGKSYAQLWSEFDQTNQPMQPIAMDWEIA